MQAFLFVFSERKSKKMELNTTQIQEIIPHRYPFLLVDKITELVPGERAVGIKATTVNESFYQGHFPGYPVMPGVLVIEALAQVGAIIMLSMDENKGKKVLFGGIKNARFKQQITPGDIITLECVVTKSRGAVGFGMGKATVNGKIATQAEISFAIID